MSIFDAHYLFFFLFFFFVLLFLTSIIRSVAMHAFVREEGCQSESFHLCMNSNHSAGGGRLGRRRRGVFTWQEERSRAVM